MKRIKILILARKTANYFSKIHKNSFHLYLKTQNQIRSIYSKKPQNCFKIKIKQKQILNQLQIIKLILISITIILLQKLYKIK